MWGKISGYKKCAQGAHSSPWPVGVCPNVTRGAGFEWGQLRAGPKLLFSVGVEAARLLAGRSRRITNLLGRGSPSFKTVPMFKGPHGAGPPRARLRDKVFILLTSWRHSDLRQLCRHVYPSALLIQAWPKLTVGVAK